MTAGGARGRGGGGLQARLPPDQAEPAAHAHVQSIRPHDAGAPSRLILRRAGCAKRGSASWLASCRRLRTPACTCTGCPVACLMRLHSVLSLLAALCAFMPPPDAGPPTVPPAFPSACALPLQPADRPHRPPRAWASTWRPSRRWTEPCSPPKGAAASTASSCAVRAPQQLRGSFPAAAPPTHAAAREHRMCRAGGLLARSLQSPSRGCACRQRPHCAAAGACYHALGYHSRAVGDYSAAFFERDEGLPEETRQQQARPLLPL